MKINLLFAASLALSFNAFSQVEIEPFAPTVPGTYIGDFDGIPPGADIPTNSVATEEGDTGGANNNWLGEDGTVTANFVGNIGDYAVGQCENGQELYLVSPEMDFGTNTLNPSMAFRYAIDNGAQGGFPGGFGNANLDVVYKESSGGAWTTVATYTTIDNTWHDETIDLSGAGSYATFYLAFRIYTVSPGSFFTWGYLAVDEIVVTGEAAPSCTPTTSSFTVDVCSDYTVPSGDETYSVNGTVMDTIPNNAGCDSVMTITVNVVVPDVSITNTAGTLMAGASGMTYQWIDCSDDSQVAGETGQSFTPTTNGDYAVIVTDTGCPDTSACENISGLGIDHFETSIKFYPNPVNDVLTIETAIMDNVQLQLISIEGKVLRSINIANTPKYTLDVSSLSKGAYVLKLVDADGQSIQKTIFKQ